MYKILIVEDEELELVSLKKIIAGSFECFDLIQTASSGEAALECIQESAPDIVLMDIHLGSYNGLNLSEIILEENPDTRIIVVTAFDQFAYAQQAVKLGIADFLLKPVTTKNLIAAVQQQMESIEECRKKALSDARLNINFENIKEIFSLTFTGSIINNIVNDNTAEILSALHIPQKNMCVMALSYVVHKIKLTKKEDIVLKKIIVDIIKKEICGPTVFFDIINSDNITLCLFYPNGPVSNIKIARDIRHSIISNLHLIIKIGISSMVGSLADLGNAYKQAALALKIGGDTINQYSDYLETLHTGSEIGAYLFDFVSSIIKGTAEDIEKLLSSLQSAFETGQSFSSGKTFCIMLWINIIKELESKINFKNFNYEKEITLPIIDMLNANCTGDLLLILRENILNLTENTRSVLQSNSNYITKRAQKFIDDRFAEPLTLNAIAEKLNISPYYLSHIFKTELGVNVIEYLNRTRIEQSKKLLIENRLPVKDIAFQTGFSDANYFCRVFKKMTGTTPSVFKNMNI